MDNTILIYGATGYMGKLFAKELSTQGVQPILAARSTKVQALAQQLNCPSVIFSLDNVDEIVSKLAGITLVVNLAGPFAKTQAPLIQACLKTGCHYIDIAGEVDEMVSAFAFDDAAKQAGIMLMPGAGFGVVPTDLVAYCAKQQLPDASTLKILYATEGEVSRGTLKTVLKTINQPGVRRSEGRLITAYPAESTMTFEVAGKAFTAVYNPWRADLFTAGLSTGIENIQTYSVFPGFVVKMMKGKLLWLRNLLVNRLLRFLPEGPTEKQLEQGSSYVMAIASNPSTEVRVALKGPEAYLFTALCLREVSRCILDGQVKAGFQPPSYFGTALLEGLDGIQWD